MDRKARREFTSVVARVFAPRDVVEIGGPYLDRRSCPCPISPASWRRCMSSNLAVRYRRRDGFRVHDLSVCDAREAPKLIGRRESRLLASNAVAVAGTVLFCGDEGGGEQPPWDWEVLLADFGYLRDERASRRFARRLARCRHLPPSEFGVYRPIEWKIW